MITPPNQKKDQTAPEKKKQREKRQYPVNASNVIGAKGGGHTDVIQVHDLIVANLRVLCFSGNDEFMTSGYRDLREKVKTQGNRRSEWEKYL